MDIHFEDKEKFLVDENNELRNRLDAYEAMLAIMIQKMGNQVLINDVEIYQIINSKTEVVQISGFGTHGIVLTTREGTKEDWEIILKTKIEREK